MGAVLKVASVADNAVEVICVPKGSSDSRRLAETVSFMYKITVASATAATELADQIKGSDKAVLAEAISSHLLEGSPFKGNITVLEITAQAVVVTITTTTTPEKGNGSGGDELSDAHARTPAALVAFSMAAIAATL